MSGPATGGKAVTIPVLCAQECPRSCRLVGQSKRAGSAAVLGRINPTTGLAPVPFLRIQRSTIDRLAAKLTTCLSPYLVGGGLRVCPHIAFQDGSAFPADNRHSWMSGWERGCSFLWIPLRPGCAVP